MRSRSWAESSRSSAPSASSSRSPAAGADQRDDVLAAREHPGDRHLGDARARVLGDAAQRLDQRQVALEVLALEARAERPEVALPQVAVLRPVTRDQPAGKHAVRGDRDAELAAGGQDLLLQAARQQRVLDLQVGDRVDGGGAADRLGADLGQADVAHVAGLDHLRDRPDRLLDRHVRVEPRGPVLVGVVRAQAAERVGQRALHGLRPRVVAQPAVVGAALGAELDADLNRVAVATLQGARDQHLVVAHPVEVAGVDQVDTGVQRGVDRGDALGLVGGPVQIGHAHAPEADRRDLRAGCSKLSNIHD